MVSPLLFEGCSKLTWFVTPQGHKAEILHLGILGLLAAVSLSSLVNRLRLLFGAMRQKTGMQLIIGGHNPSSHRLCKLSNGSCTTKIF
jgi:hypothetical protein